MRLVCYSVSLAMCIMPYKCQSHTHLVNENVTHFEIGSSLSLWFTSECRCRTNVRAVSLFFFLLSDSLLLVFLYLSVQAKHRSKKNLNNKCPATNKHDARPNLKHICEQCVLCVSRRPKKIMLTAFSWIFTAFQFDCSM